MCIIYLRMEQKIFDVLLSAPLLSNTTLIPGSCSEIYFIVKACARVNRPSYSLVSFDQQTKNSPLDRNHLSVARTHTRHR